MNSVKLIGRHTCPLVGLALLGRHVPPHFYISLVVASVLLTYASMWRSLSSERITQLPRSKWDGFINATSWLFIGIMALGLIDGLWISRNVPFASLFGLLVGAIMNLVWVFSGMFSVLRRTNRASPMLQ